MQTRDPAALLRRAEMALGSGDNARARDICRTLLETWPAYADAHFVLGMAAVNAGDLVNGMIAVRNAARLKPSPLHLTQLSRLLVMARRDAEALAVADRVVAQQPDDALMLDTLGSVYSRVGAHERALPLFAAAVQRRPEHPQMRFNYAASLGFLGRFEEAETQYEAAIRLKPDFAKAHAALSATRTQTAERNHVARLETLLAEVGSDSRDGLHLHYALAKEYEDLQNADQVFAHLDAANRRHKARLGYSIERDRAIFESLMAAFARDDYFRGEGDRSAAPIFVFGLPRTGTTLVDRILSSHPDVESAGELQVLQMALKRLVRTPSRVVLDPETIAAASAVSPQALGAAYLEGSRPHRKTAPRRFLDKLPLNFLYAGYIARALPEAKLVCLRRHPMDSVWSNYRHLFATDFSYYDYSYDLLDCAEYYVLFDRLMAYWRQRFPGRVLEVRYDELVDDVEPQARRLLAHCGLSWNDRCLRFHENAGAVATPSATQVRQPIYKGARGRWRRYAQFLDPVATYFAEQRIAVP
ncbi:MAG: sulfotransferase [Solimonas sp.]